MGSALFGVDLLSLRFGSQILWEYLDMRWRGETAGMIKIGRTHFRAENRTLNVFPLFEERLAVRYTFACY
jgi:hypothetical protein